MRTDASCAAVAACGAVVLVVVDFFVVLDCGASDVDVEGAGEIGAVEGVAFGFALLLHAPTNAIAITVSTRARVRIGRRVCPVRAYYPSP
jgi:hypothetical protein